MTWTPKPLSVGDGLPPRGQAPIAPDTPFDEDLYDAVIAAMDDLIAQGDPRSMQEADGKP